MAEQIISVKLVLDSNLREQMGQQSQIVQEETGKMGGLVSKLGIAIAGAFTVEKVLEFGKACVEAYDKSEQAATRLNTALGYNATSLYAQAAALQKTTRFEDDSITNAQALLAMYGLSAEQIKKLTPAILDYASATGTDLNSATEKVGKTVTTATNVLAREGITISDATSKSQKLAEVTKTLEERFKGQAEASGNVGAGSIIKLSHAFGDLMENIGQAITKSEIYQEGVKKLSDELEHLKILTRGEAQANAQNDIMIRLKEDAEEAKKTIENLNESLKQERANPSGGFFEGIAEDIEHQITVKKAELKIIEDDIKKLTPQEDKHKPRKKDKIDSAEALKGEWDIKKDQLATEEAYQKILSDKRISRMNNEEDETKTAAQLQEDIDMKIAEAYNHKIELAEKLKEANMENAASMLGSAATINTALKGSAEASKALALGQAVVNTALAITKVMSQAGVISPFLIPAIIAQGAAQIAVISAQKFALGGDFTTSGPQMIMVGDNPGGRERVSVTPLSSQNVNGPQAGNINMGNTYISGNADAGTVKALNQSREKQLKNLKKMLMELSYARQMPSMA